MSKKDVLEWFAVNYSNLSGSKILLLMALGIFIGAVIYMTYRLTYDGVSYSAKFNASNVIILLITVVIMLMISSNVVISLGMVGALSIVRFRTAVKDPRDTVYIFWSIVEGLCVGSQNVKLTLMSTVVIALVILGFSFIEKKKDRYVLVIRGNGEEIDEGSLEECISAFSTKHELKNVNTTGTMTELVYEICVKGKMSLQSANDLKKIAGVENVNWLKETNSTLG